MLEELNNSCLAKKDNYPTSVEDVVMLLSHCQGHQFGVRNVMDDNTVLETSFAQLNRMSKLRCYECNELGHVRTKCPKLKKNSHFQNEEGDDSARASTPSGWASQTMCDSYAGHGLDIKSKECAGRHGYLHEQMCI